MEFAVRQWLHERNLGLHYLSRTDKRVPVAAREYKGAVNGQGRPIMWRAAWGSTVLLSINIEKKLEPEP